MPPSIKILDAGTEDEAVGFVARRQADPDTERLYIIVAARDGGVEFRAFGNTHRSDLSFAAAILLKLATAELEFSEDDDDGDAANDGSSSS